MQSTTKKKTLPEPSLSGLSEKKSERTTFKLTKEATVDLEWLQKQYQLSAKELFDYLCSKLLKENNILLLDCIKLSSKDVSEEPKKSSIRKTYVLSRGSIKELTDISKQNELSRDMFVSNLISAFRGMVKHEIEEEQAKQKLLNELLNKFNAEAKKTEKMLIDLIPNTDILSKFKKITELTEKLTTKVNIYTDSIN